MSFSTTFSAPGIATVKYYDAGKSAPVLNDGIIMPSILHLWKKKADIFFNVQKIDVADQVKTILAYFSSQSIVNWINENEDDLRTLSWADFMTQLKKNVLTPGWDMVVFRSMVNVKQPKSESFLKWMNGGHSANFSLSDTCFHKGAQALHAHLESHISDDLADYLTSMTKNEQEQIEAIQDLEEWLWEMMEIDDKMSKTRKRHMKLVEKAVKCQQTSFTTFHSSAPRPQPALLSVVTPTASRQTTSNVLKFSSLLRTKIDIPPGY